MTQTSLKNPILCAIDTADLESAQSLAHEIAPHIGGIKLGLEFFLKCGADGVKYVTKGGEIPLFLDLKFHDIPNTVTGAVRSVMQCTPFMLTVHTSGGEAMLRAAKETATEQAEKLGITAPSIIGVTMLTSMDDSDLKDIGMREDVPNTAKQLTSLAKNAMIDGIVCSGHELSSLHAKNDSEFLYVTPGIRLHGHSQDQKRIMTPQEAIEQGASYLVIGREITQSDNKQYAIQQILENIG